MLELLIYHMSKLASWQTIGSLTALVVLETVLSADNAVALAALAQEIPHPQQQRLALNWGLVAAFGLRMLLLLTASWILQFWQFELAGGLYLLWLATKHFWDRWTEVPSQKASDAPASVSLSSLQRIVGLIALTDLAFSIDSVTTAVALSDQLWLVLTGGMIGIITLRFLAGLFVRWLEEFPYLHHAAYLTVLGVGMRLLLKAVMPDYLPPDWTMLMAIGILFGWGFSRRALPDIQTANVKLSLK